mmetsp:Transcript_1864/g.3540  ORF Transcript_1864/g.3540 Transcript_1864/m.3540 type:complete len:277 (-) Transcript_1864:267-1097(-)
MWMCFIDRAVRVQLFVRLRVRCLAISPPRLFPSRLSAVIDAFASRASTMLSAPLASKLLFSTVSWRSPLFSVSALPRRHAPTSAMPQRFNFNVCRLELVLRASARNSTGESPNMLLLRSRERSEPLVVNMSANATTPSSINKLLDKFSTRSSVVFPASAVASSEQPSSPSTFWLRSRCCRLQWRSAKRRDRCAAPAASTGSLHTVRLLTKHRGFFSSSFNCVMVRQSIFIPASPMKALWSTKQRIPRHFFITLTTVLAKFSLTSLSASTSVCTPLK